MWKQANINVSRRKPREISHSALGALLYTVDRAGLRDQSYSLDTSHPPYLNSRPSRVSHSATGLTPYDCCPADHAVSVTISIRPLTIQVRNTGILTACSLPEVPWTMGSWECRAEGVDQFAIKLRCTGSDTHAVIYCQPLRFLQVTVGCVPGARLP
jgi:hypothetical protein